MQALAGGLPWIRRQSCLNLLLPSLYGTTAPHTVREVSADRHEKCCKIVFALRQFQVNFKEISVAGLLLMVKRRHVGKLQVC